MSKRFFWSLLGIASLLLGFLIYLLFRPYTYVAVSLQKYPFMKSLQEMARPYCNPFLQFYLGDYLWGFALGCGLQTIYVAERLDKIWIAVIVFLSGTVWELLQFGGITSGTGDFLDVIMYFLASLTIMIICKKERLC